ncbi:hypothetical protein EDD21DRAFT_374815 [Dissophora ornata]|nr:hypothetical protein EDD21DRAFT_374815 [Dissophora ornata]
MAARSEGISLIGSTVLNLERADAILSILSGTFDHILEPVPVTNVHVQDGIEYGHAMFGYNVTPKRREDYIHLQYMYSAPATTGMIASFRQVVATYQQPPESNTRSSNSDSNPLMDREDHTEVYRLLQHGTQCLPGGFIETSYAYSLSDKNLHEYVIEKTKEDTVLGFVGEVLAHRLVYQECEDFILRHLYLVCRVALNSAEQEKGDMATWLQGVADWSLRTARSFEAGDSTYQDQCCALLLEIGAIRNHSTMDISPALTHVSYMFDFIRQSASAVCALGLMCSGLPASQLLFQAARLSESRTHGDGLDMYLLERHSRYREMIAEYGKQAGLCYGRVYQWVTANWPHGFTFAEYCRRDRREQVTKRTGKVDVIDTQHLDCVSRCEHGKSTSAGHAGHMPWCKGHKKTMILWSKGCKETTIPVPEHDGIRLVVFDTFQKKLRHLKNGETYVAISHVWGQRLFGQDTRTLGQCALSELKRLAAYKGVECVWLDTLCVPSDPVARRNCIDGMRSIYQDAACVAVYDKGIMTADATDTLGFAFEVSISDWNSRVWTLQEGLLNRTVIYAQKKEYIPHMKPRVHSFFLWHTDHVAYAMLEHIAHGSIQEIDPHTIFSMAAGRTTSHDVDYVCGLGALLPQPLARIGADLNTAVVAMAQTFATVDIGLLCSNSPRSNVEGYCWMPLGCKDIGQVTTSGVIGTVLDKGLRVEADAFQIVKLYRVSSLPPELSEIRVFGGEYLFTDEQIILATPKDISLDTTYDFICGYGDHRAAGGFLVTKNSNDVVQYVTSAIAYGRLCLSKKTYVIGGPGECSVSGEPTD